MIFWQMPESIGYNIFILCCSWKLGGKWVRHLVLAIADTENDHFASVSAGTMNKSATKYFPENTEKMTRWSITPSRIGQMRTMPSLLMSSH